MVDLEYFQLNILNLKRGIFIMKRKLLSIMMMLTLAVSASVPVCGDEIMGDVNEDGILTAADAALVLNYVLDNSTEINVEKAKVFADGKITAANSAAILAKVLDASFVYPDSEEDMTTNIPKIDVPDDMVNGINLNDYEIVREYNFEDIAPGVYTEDIVVGDMIIPAAENFPVYIDEVDVTINGHHYTRKMRMISGWEIIKLSKVKGSDYFNILLNANSPKYAAESAFNIQSIIKSSGTIDGHGTGGWGRFFSNSSEPITDGFTNHLIKREGDGNEDVTVYLNTAMGDYYEYYAFFTLDKKQ